MRSAIDHFVPVAIRWEVGVKRQEDASAVMDGLDPIATNAYPIQDVNMEVATR